MAIKRKNMIQIKDKHNSWNQDIWKNFKPSAINSPTDNFWLLRFIRLLIDGRQLKGNSQKSLKIVSQVSKQMIL